ncbi:AAA family ATPase [Proteus terrae]|uniref:AAA family ATPase n=1 Tax=Proteus terrae TaxID=1574161 RepID=UPI00301BED85
MFTLLSFKITHKEKEIYNCTFADVQKHTRSLPLSSVIIGENGSGKSYLLSQVADFFRFIQRIISKDKKSYFKYENASIEFIIDSDKYIINKEKSKVIVFINGVHSELHLVKLPTKVITMSFMVNDKFSFSRYEDDDFYDYRGIRATSNASYTSTIKRIIINSLISSISNNAKLETVRDTLHFLEMSKNLAITYTLNRKTLFKKKLPLQSITKKIESIEKRKKYINEVELNKIKKNPEIILHDIEILYNECSHINGKIHLNLNLEHKEPIVNTAILQSLSRLERLEFITNPDIVFYKKDNFSFEETSSGEKNIIFTILNLISSIKMNSLLLIDEPELSLHPTWQMKYINFIKEAIKSNLNCHLIFASHSHFMLSDLEPESSSLISISQHNSERICEYIEHSTYAWSVDNILYKVFHLRTTRNTQVEIELYELSGLISKNSDNIQRIKELINNLNKIVLDVNDPLNIIINQGRVYIGDYDDK